MLEMRQAIETMAENRGIEVTGLDSIPTIVQGRPMFDFVGVDENMVQALGLDMDDLYVKEGRENIAIFPDGRVEGLRTVSEQYNLLQHWNAIHDVFQSLPVDFNLEKIKIVTSENGGRCFARFYSGHKIEIVKGDDIQYQLLMENSADTTTKFNLSGGAWRLICSNGMIIPDNRIEQIKKKKLHKGGLNLESEISEFLEIMETSIDSMGLWKQYTNKKLSAPQLEDVFQALEAGPRVQEEILDLDLRGEQKSVRYQLEHHDLSAWDVYNAFTQRITDSDSSELVKVERGAKVSKVLDAMVLPKAA